MVPVKGIAEINCFKNIETYSKENYHNRFPLYKIKALNTLILSPLNILFVKTNDDLVVDYPNCNITLVHVFRIQIIW